MRTESKLVCQGNQWPNPGKTWCMVPYAGVDYKLPLCSCSLHSRLQHIYHGQPYAGVDFIPRSGPLNLASAMAVREGQPS